MNNRNRSPSFDLRSELLRAFRAAFGESSPDAHIVRAPGRVNLMGDHIDYLGFDVLPFAIPRHIHVLFKPRTDNGVRIINVDTSYTPVTFEVGARVPGGSPGSWGNYARAAVQGLFRDDCTCGFEAVVASDLPAAAGLSSSSALVVAFALTYLRANRARMNRRTLAERLARAERYVGTQGGGMDQAVCLLARKGRVCHIAFNPLDVSYIPVPADWRFVIAPSLERAEKSGAHAAAYNLRAHEAATALERMHPALVDAAQSGDSGTAPWNWRDQLRRAGASSLLDPATDVLTGVELRRYRHVITEAQRVTDACAAIEARDLHALGGLLDASHASLCDDYEVSTPALDELTTQLRAAGAAGARLTGAGFGGCAVAVCTADAAPRIIAGLARTFYASHRDPHELCIIAGPAGKADTRRISREPGMTNGGTA